MTIGMEMQGNGFKAWINDHYSLSATQPISMFRRTAPVEIVLNCLNYYPDNSDEQTLTKMLRIKS